MSDIDFKNGFLCGLLGTGLGIGGTASGGSTEGTTEKLPSLDQLKIVNLAGYDNVTTYLKKEYQAIISTSFGYVPSQGYLMIGGWYMIDSDSDDWWVTPEVDIRFTLDGNVIYEGDTTGFFQDMMMDPPMAYQYKSSFELAAKRRNLTDGMMFWLMDTMIVGLK